MLAIVFLHGFAQTPASWRPVIGWLTPDQEVPDREVRRSGWLTLDQEVPDREVRRSGWLTLDPEWTDQESPRSGWLTPERAWMACPNPGHAAGWPVGAGWEATIAGLAARLPREAVVVGYSLGARLALGLLARDAIRGAVLIGVNPGLADPDERAARRRADAAWAERLRRDGTGAFLDAWEAQPVFATAARAAAAVRAERRAARERLDPHGLAAAMEVLGLGAMPDLSEALVARADRARIVVGADDGKFRQIAAGLAVRAEALTPVIVDGSGHDPTLEQPEALARVIAEAITRWA